MTSRDGMTDRDELPDESPEESDLEPDVEQVPRGAGARLTREEALRLLREGDLELVGRLVTASNFTLFAKSRLERPGEPVLETACVYKPVRGEAPLWDFPDGTLAAREVAAHAVSVASGWDIVPPTVMRDGPLGPGMVQLWIDIDESVDVVDLVRRAEPCLRPVALFDAVVNNADRKAGHLLPFEGGRLHGVDHGVCFAVEPKLRTILWAWRGEGLLPAEIEVLRHLRKALDGTLGAELRALLAPAEVRATARRLDTLLATCAFPQPDPDRPAIPWPWY